MNTSFLQFHSRFAAITVLLALAVAPALGAATANPSGGGAASTAAAQTKAADASTTVSPERAAETAARFFDPLLADAKTDRERAGILHQRGVLYLRSNCRDLALSDLNRAVQLLPAGSDERADLLFHRACAFLLLPTPDTNAALRDVAVCLELAPNDVEALIVRGEAYQLSGNREGADADFARAATIMPKGDAAIRAMLQNARNRTR